jgi:hypothetical protein
MICILNWLHALDIKYSTSTFDTDPFEPQPEAVSTIFPFWFGNSIKNKGFVELPYTLAQDCTLFVILKEKSTAIWRDKLNWIAEKGGMALLNTHPDYMCFGKNACEREEYPAELYEEFLGYVKEQYAGQYWAVNSENIAEFWSKNYKTD